MPSILTRQKQSFLIIKSSYKYSHLANSIFLDNDLEDIAAPHARSNGNKNRKNIPGFYESEIGVWGYDDSRSQDGAGDECSGGDD
ncbi:hypothetical protein [Chryseolinea sp. H1M3-3]|uniref:hypothetical protein n=1 Tax=Chryseolinea sp. H1M3-3 TaxID=3034144 RepID=UPI0023EC0A30|nr:hypothetical protein [Chryseolinea sp. H1M3-3]